MKNISEIKNFLHGKFSTSVVPRFSPFLTSEFDLEALEKMKKICEEEGD